MATKKNPLDEQDDLNQSVNLQSGMVGAGMTNGSPGASKAQGTGWTNFQQYLETNKGAGNAIADVALGEARSQVDSTKNDIDSWQKAATDRANSSAAKDNWSATINNSSVDDLNKLDKDQFQSWKSLGSYWGMSDAGQDSGYDAVQKKSDKTAEQIDNANTWQGQQQALIGAYGKTNNNYTSGMGALDAFVARGDAQGQFDEFKSANQNFGSNLNTAKGSVNSAIGQAKAVGDQNYNKVMDSVKSRYQSLAPLGAQRANEQARADDSAVRSYLNQIVAPSGSKLTNEEINGMIQKGSYSVQDGYSAAEREALNRLADFDSSLAKVEAGPGFTKTELNAGALDQWLAQNPSKKASSADIQGKDNTISSDALDTLAKTQETATKGGQSYVDAAGVLIDPTNTLDKPVDKAASWVKKRFGI